MRLCEQAANEQDPERLIALVGEINRLLGEKEQRLRTGNKITSGAEAGNGQKPTG
ncbi:MAG TPA: hypothetical protein VFB00_02940 [Terriglobales bacterium]|nr:hypothetical protein [Terriglobales bacterium]